MIKIVVDAMGGDNAPGSAVDGAVQALAQFPDIEILLCGRKQEIDPLLAGKTYDKTRLQIEDAPDVITMHDAPVMAIRRKPDSSMVRAMLAVKDGRAQAFVSAGSTGAILAGGMFRIGRIEGVERPALAPIIPTPKNSYMLIDAGANADCRPEYLAHFGLMGSVYMERVLGVDKPRVGLINIGTEAEKGSELYKAAYPLLQQEPVNFIGNIEAREVPLGGCDVAVCDGFTGNVLLKNTEGLASAMMSMIKKSMLSNLRSKIGAFLVKPALREFKSKLDYNEAGGAPLLGVNGAVIKAHGSAGARAMMNAIGQARKMVEGDVVGTIRASLVKLEGASDKPSDTPQGEQQ